MLGRHAHVLRCPRRPRRRGLGMLSHEVSYRDVRITGTILGGWENRHDAQQHTPNCAKVGYLVSFR